MFRLQKRTSSIGSLRVSMLELWGESARAKAKIGAIQPCRKTGGETITSQPGHDMNAVHRNGTP